MVNTQVATRDEYFKAAGEREAALRELDAHIQKAAPHLKPHLHGGMSGKWLAYGMQPYKTKSMKEPDEWPVVAVANQKNYISLYVMAVEGDEYVAEKYKSELGKVSVGKSCIRFKKLEDVNLAGIEKLLNTIDRRFVKEGRVYAYEN